MDARRGPSHDDTGGGLADVLGGGGSHERRFCGETPLPRQAFTGRGILRPLGPKLARVARSGNVPMLGWALRDAVPHGLMASCDSFAWRSMHCGTYASANS